MKPKVFFAVPNYTKPQQILVETMTKVAEAAGLEVLLPKREDNWSTRKGLLMKATYVFAWLDYLLPKGEYMYRVSDVQYDEIAMPLPPHYIELIGIGLQAKGEAEYAPKSGIILPGQDSTGMEITNLPAAIRARAPGGIFAKMVGQGAVNIPDPGVMFEVGYAKAEKMPVVGMGIASPQVGPYANFLADLTITEFDFLEGAFAELAKISTDWEEQDELTLMDVAEKRFEIFQMYVDGVTVKRDKEVIKAMETAISEETKKDGTSGIETTTSSTKTA